LIGSGGPCQWSCNSICRSGVRVCVRVCVALPLPALSFCVTADMSHILLVITMNSHCNIYTCVCTHNFVDIRMLQCQGAPPDAIHQNIFYMRTCSTTHLITWVPQCQQVPPDDAHNSENIFYTKTYSITHVHMHSHVDAEVGRSAA